MSFLDIGYNLFLEKPFLNEGEVSALDFDSGLQEGSVKASELDGTIEGNQIGGGEINIGETILKRLVSRNEAGDEIVVIDGNGITINNGSIKVFDQNDKKIFGSSGSIGSIKTDETLMSVGSVTIPTSYTTLENTSLTIDLLEKSSVFFYTDVTYFTDAGAGSEVFGQVTFLIDSVRNPEFDFQLTKTTQDTESSFQFQKTLDSGKHNVSLQAKASGANFKITLARVGYIAIPVN